MFEFEGRSHIGWCMIEISCAPSGEDEAHLLLAGVIAYASLVAASGRDRLEIPVLRLPCTQSLSMAKPWSYSFRNE